MKIEIELKFGSFDLPKRSQSMSKSSFLVSVLLLIVFVSGILAADMEAVKTSGVIYLDYIYDVNDFGKGDGFNKFDLERAYVTFDSKISDSAKIRVRTDVYNNTKSVSFTADGKDIRVGSYYDGWAVRIKNAYVDLNLIPMTTISVGLIGTPWIPTVEKAWGYRFVKSTFPDAVKLFASADLGVSLAFKIPQNYGEFVIAVLNGNGYSKIEDDKYKDIVPRITINPLPNDDILKGLSMSGYYYLGKKASGDDSVDKTRAGGLLSFNYDFINIGGEFETSKDADVNGMGFSVFGDVKLAKFLPSPLNNLGILGRFDSWDANTDKDDDAHTVLIVGLIYSITKNVNAVINLEQKTYEVDLHKMGIVKEETSDKSTTQILAQLEAKF